MWICRRCAAHVNDEVQKCPCCATPANSQKQLPPSEAEHPNKSMSPTASYSEWPALPASSASAQTIDQDNLDTSPSQPKKPASWIPAFGERSVIKGESGFLFSAQVLVMLIIAEIIIALLAALGISTPAANGLALVFGLVIWAWVMWFLLWFALPVLIKEIANAGKTQSNITDAEDTFAEEVLSDDLPATYPIEAQDHEGIQMTPDGQKNKLSPE